jgi:hypothetical protein
VAAEGRSTLGLRTRSRACLASGYGTAGTARPPCYPPPLSSPGALPNHLGRPASAAAAAVPRARGGSSPTMPLQWHLARAPSRWWTTPAPPQLSWRARSRRWRACQASQVQFAVGRGAGGVGGARRCAADRAVSRRHVRLLPPSRSGIPFGAPPLLLGRGQGSLSDGRRAWRAPRCRRPQNDRRLPRPGRLLLHR